MSAHVEMSNAQFENVNELRSYPFVVVPSLSDRDGRRIPDDFVVDLHVAVPYACADASACERVHSVRMTSAFITRNMVSACFSVESQGRTCALSVIVSAENFVPYMPYRLEQVSGGCGSGGLVTFGNVDFDSECGRYDDGEAVVHPCCVVEFRAPGLRSFVDRRSGESVSGDSEIAFSGHVSAKLSEGGIRLSLDDGSAEELASECARVSGGDACGATPIRSINGVRPDEDGNIVLWFH